MDGSIDSSLRSKTSGKTGDTMPTTIRGALRRIARRSGRASIGIVLTGGLLLAHPVPAMATAPVAQDQTYHAFADQRSWLGVRRAADVLSNLAFLVVGIYGLVRLVARDRAKMSPATEAGVACIALGFLLTAFGSGWYHLGPTDA